MVYVTMTDKFMSGWGMAKGKTNKLVIECENSMQAEKIAYRANSCPGRTTIAINILHRGNCFQI